MSKALTIDDIEAVGRALYGERWQAPLARDLGVTGRMIGYVMAGEKSLGDDKRDRLVELLTARGDEVRETLRRLGA